MTLTADTKRAFVTASFDEYQSLTHKTAAFDPDVALPYLTLGLIGEAGEVSEKIKKLFRKYGLKPFDIASGLSDEEIAVFRAALKLELGDVLWYLAQLSSLFGFTLSDIATSNLVKLFDRKARDVVLGEGDNR